jgi:hypothetical protein
MTSRRDHYDLRPASAAAQPVQRRAGESVAITGHLGADTVEGGGAYLETADGRRYEVIWPRGWRLDRGRLKLIDDRGRAVADGGDVIILRGTIADDIASIHQLGPIIRAATVEVGRT